MARNLCHFLKTDGFDPLKRLFPSLRLYSANPMKKTENVAPVYTKRDNEFKMTKKGTISTLEQLLQLKKFDASNIVMDNNCFKYVSKATLKGNYTVFKQKGITQETLFKYPEILTVLETEQKLQIIEKLKYDINEVAILLLLNVPSLEQVEKNEENPEVGIIATLSSLLQIDYQKACEYIVNKPFLCFLSTEKIKTKIKILTSYGIPLEEICNDLWVLRYREQLIEERLSRAKEYNIGVAKTWMVRAKQEVFQTYIQRRSDNKSILGNSSLAEYLSERLECSVEIANYMITKQPALQNKSLKKLKELIDLLYAEGFQPQQIIRVPKILVHSVETTRKRLQQLTEKGIKIDTLSLLTKSQNQFMQYYEALLKNKNKSKIKTS
ncbi:transcription termination factor, mitochondrial [Tribolium madens]|uniref:transcription termination factor, mitochondrial n=1 Tax=Tribolium madens TaxID=41895 RepID=UPI001CF76578|nr:transcription termination factor, mitochondrial [Tribolium madens]